MNIPRFILTGLLGALLASSAQGQAVQHRNPIIRFASGVGHEAHETVLDFKRHPVSWGLFASLQLGVAFADTGSSCNWRAQNSSLIETGPSHYFIGRRPSCGRFVAWTSGAMAVHLVAEHKLSSMFLESCQREAANPASRWWNTPAHTHDPNSCRWAIPAADTLALSAYEIPIIHSNIELAGQRH